jgi:hypothetical protein
MKNEDLVGVWRELGREIVCADGSVVQDVKRNSQIMYSPDGYMCVGNTPIRRGKVNESVGRMDLDATSAEEPAQAMLGVVAYAGRFKVSGEDGVPSSPRSIPTGSATRNCGTSRLPATT